MPTSVHSLTVSQLEVRDTIHRNCFLTLAKNFRKNKAGPSVWKRPCGEKTPAEIRQTGCRSLNTRCLLCSRQHLQHSTADIPLARTKGPPLSSLPTELANGSRRASEWHCRAEFPVPVSCVFAAPAAAIQVGESIRILPLATC